MVEYNDEELAIPTGKYLIKITELLDSVTSWERFNGVAIKQKPAGYYVGLRDRNVIKASNACDARKFSNVDRALHRVKYLTRYYGEQYRFDLVPEYVNVMVRTLSM